MSKCRLKPPNSISDGIFCAAICLYNGGGVSRLRCCRNATEPSFPRKWESSGLNLNQDGDESRRQYG
ncbi:hypothetical protein EZZ75_02090 [Neisseria meningitidis]|nr:hypothetical protein [Neisseria meningitidis]